MLDLFGARPAGEFCPALPWLFHIIKRLHLTRKARRIRSSVSNSQSGSNKTEIVPLPLRALTRKSKTRELTLRTRTRPRSHRLAVAFEAQVRRKIIERLAWASLVDLTRAV